MISSKNLISNSSSRIYKIKKKKTHLKDVVQHPLEHGLLCNGVFPCVYGNYVLK